MALLRTFDVTQMSAILAAILNTDLCKSLLSFKSKQFFILEVYNTFA